MQARDSGVGQKGRLNVPSANLSVAGSGGGWKKGIRANTFTEDDTVGSLGWPNPVDSNVVAHLLPCPATPLYCFSVYPLPPLFQLSSVNRIPYLLSAQHLYISYRGFPTPSRARADVCGAARPNGDLSSDYYRPTGLNGIFRDICFELASPFCWDSFLRMGIFRGMSLMAIF